MLERIKSVSCTKIKHVSGLVIISDQPNIVVEACPTLTTNVVHET